MPILTQTHRDHFDEYGYMVIENAVPTELCDAVVDAIFAFLEMDPSDPNNWYRATQTRRRYGGNVPTPSDRGQRLSASTDLSDLYRSIWHASDLGAS